MPTLTQLVLRSTRVSKFHKPKSRQLRQCPHKKAVVAELRQVKPKKPNSAIRKIAKVRITSSNKRVLAYIQGTGHNLQKFSVVLLRGGRVKDLPGVQYHIVKGALEFSSAEDIVRRKSRSKYGIKRYSA